MRDEEGDDAAARCVRVLTLFFSEVIKKMNEMKHHKKDICDSFCTSECDRAMAYHLRPAGEMGKKQFFIRCR